MAVEITSEAWERTRQPDFTGVTLTNIDLFYTDTLIKRLPIKAVQVPDPITVHIKAQDSTNDAYGFDKMHIFTSDNLLFAIITNDNIGLLHTKSHQASLVLSFSFDLLTTPGAVLPSSEENFTGLFAAEDVQGIAEIATQPETDTGQDDTRIVTPKKLAGWWTTVKNSLTVPSATEETEGIAKIATEEEYRDVNQDTTIITPKKLKNWWSWFTQYRSEARATETVRGVARFATKSETINAASGVGLSPIRLRDWWYDYLRYKFDEAAFLPAGDDYGDIAKIGYPQYSEEVAVVVDSGSNSYGYWRKYSDGTIVQRSRIGPNFTGNFFFSFPVAFTSLETISIVQSEISGYEPHYITLSNLTTTGVIFCNLSEKQQYNWLAMGK